MNAASAGRSGLDASMGQLANGLARLDQSVRQVPPSLGLLERACRTAARDARTVAGESSKSLQQQARQITAVKMTLEEVNDVFKKIETRAGELTEQKKVQSPEEVYREEIARYRQAVADARQHGMASDTIVTAEKRIATIERLEGNKYDTSFFKGVRDKATDYASTIKSMAELAGIAFNNVFKDLENVLTNWVKTGKLQFGDLVSSFVDSLKKMAMEMMIVNPFKGLLQGLFGSGTEKGGGFFADIGRDIGRFFGGLFTNAHGNVFPAGTGLSAYRNSVVSGPTYFAFAKGGVPNLGLMGEAGAEAILPLVRLGNGDLGVRSTGGERSNGSVSYTEAPVTNNIYIEGSGKDPKEIGAEVLNQLSTHLDRGLKGLVKDTLRSEMRAGGLLARRMG